MTMTMNQGLFDIQVPLGGAATAEPASNGIVHSGTTTGPANSGRRRQSLIYMVAVPKNQALTMLLDGTIGFDAAGDDRDRQERPDHPFRGLDISDTDRHFQELRSRH